MSQNNISPQTTTPIAIDPHFNTNLKADKVKLYVIFINDFSV